MNDRPSSDVAAAVTAVNLAGGFLSLVKRRRNPDSDLPGWCVLSSARVRSTPGRNQPGLGGAELPHVDCPDVTGKDMALQPATEVGCLHVTPLSGTLRATDTPLRVPDSTPLLESQTS